MAKAISEKDVIRLHQSGKLDYRTLKKPAAKKPDPPKVPSGSDAMSRMLNEIYKTSKDIVDRNEKVAKVLENMVGVLEKKNLGSRPRVKGLKVTERDSNGWTKNIEVIYETKVTAERVE